MAMDPDPTYVLLQKVSPDCERLIRDKAREERACFFSFFSFPFGYLIKGSKRGESLPVSVSHECQNIPFLNKLKTE